MDDWNNLKDYLKIGTIVSVVVRKHEPYGIFADTGHSFEGLIQIVDMKDAGAVTPVDYPAVGARIDAVVLGFKDHGQQIWLGIKPSQLGKATR